MSFETDPLIIAIAGVNLLAVLLLMIFGRERRVRPSRAPREAPPRPAARERVAPRSGDPFQTLVNEAEQAEASLRRATRGEEQLARNLARWRGRATGQPLPGAAVPGRSGAGSHRRGKVA